MIYSMAYPVGQLHHESQSQAALNMITNVFMWHSNRRSPILIEAGLEDCADDVDGPCLYIYLHHDLDQHDVLECDRERGDA